METILQQDFRTMSRAEGIRYYRFLTGCRNYAAAEGDLETSTNTSDVVDKVADYFNL